MIEFGVARSTTLLEPRPSAIATSELAGVVGHTLGTRDRGWNAGCTNGPRGCCRAHVEGIDKRHAINSRYMT